MELRALKRLPGSLKVISSIILHVRQLVVLFALLCLLWCDAIAVAGDEVHRIKNVKAAYVLNIARFVTWPPGVFEKKDSPCLLCLYRSNPLGRAIETIRGKQISARHLRVDTIDRLEESSNCSILFIPHMELSHFTAEVSGEIQRPLLTITDLTTEDVVTGISRRGVMVSMIREGARIALEVDLQQARNARLRISSQLLKLARIVRNGSE